MTRHAKITPDQVGLPTGGVVGVARLRREDVATPGWREAVRMYWTAAVDAAVRRTASPSSDLGGTFASGNALGAVGSWYSQRCERQVNHDGTIERWASR